VVEGLKSLLAAASSARNCERIAHLNPNPAKWRLFEFEERKMSHWGEIERTGARRQECAWFRESNPSRRRSATAGKRARPPAVSPTSSALAGVAGYPRIAAPDVDSQVPAFSDPARAMIDVPSITRDRSLAVVELKPTRHSPATCKGWIPGAEDWHHTRGEFPRLGYFPDRELSPSRHCPSSSPQRCVCIAQPTHSCITSRPRCNGLYRGIDERWRTAVRVIFRKHANCLPGQIPRCARN